MSAHVWPLDSVRSYFVLHDKKWNWRHIAGVLFLFAGITSLTLLRGLPGGITVSYYAMLLLVCSVLQFFRSLHQSSLRQQVWHIVMATFLFVVGVSLLSEPLLTSTTFEFLMVVSLVCLGVTQVVMAEKERKILAKHKRTGIHTAPALSKSNASESESVHPNHRWVGRMLGGIVTIIAALLIFWSWPQSLFWTLGIYISAEMLLAAYSRLRKTA